jgi:hypothetical protein
MNKQRLTTKRAGMRPINRMMAAVAASAALFVGGGSIAAAQSGTEIVEPPPSSPGPTGCPSTTLNPDASRAERGGFDPTPPPHEHPEVEDTFDGGFCEEGVDPDCGVTISCDDPSTEP